MADNNKIMDKKEYRLIKEYEKLMETSSDSFIVPVQWSNEGDSIERFSLYENYTPVKTSGDTSPNNQ